VAASATSRSDFSARRRWMQIVIRTGRPTRPTAVNTAATSPLFEKNLDGGGFEVGFGCRIVYVTHVLDDAFETGYLVGKTEVVEGAGIKSVDVVSTGIEVVGRTTVIEVEDDKEVEEVMRSGWSSIFGQSQILCVLPLS
jgi:hypothetical protein